MERRRFLAALSALGSLGVAGCPEDLRADDTAAPTETPVDTPGVATPTGTASPTATATGTATAADTGTETETDAETDTETASPGSDLPALATDGKWLVDEDGNEVVLRGLATVEPLWGMNYADQRGADYWESLDRLTDESNGWYPSVVRIPCTTEYEKLGIETYAERFLDPIVEHCADNGVYALIDHHLVKEYESDETDRLMRTFWETVAPRYADDSHVLYELYNEPTEPAHWGDDEAAWSAWKEIAQPWVDLVREHAPETPLVVGSPRWTSLPHMAVEDPFEGKNLVYAGHIYPDNGQPGEFDDTYGAPAEDVPVMITEFGWDATSDSDVDQGTTSGWGDPFFEWLESYENVSWIGWCYDPVWGPPLVDADWNLLGGDSFAGHTMKRQLFENRTNRTPDAVTSSGAAYAGPDDVSPPPVPAGVTTDVVSEREFRVRWDGVSDAETSTQYYTVYLDGDVESIVRDGTSHVVGGDADQTYEVSVSAADALSNESARTDPVTHETGTEPGPAAEIAKTASAPTIDGDDDGWSEATTHEFRHVIQGTVDGERDLSGGWRARWDGEALYVLVDVTDDQRSTDSADHYDDDSVEVYVDADNSGGNSYDGENDFHFSFPRDDGEMTGIFPRGVAAVEWSRAETDDGYRIECAFPWSVLGVSPEAGHQLGFDVHVNDDDDGDGRDAKLSWAADTDMAWDDPSLFATVELTD
ncbi:sugar-binding protein [Halosimplex sp. J119]